ncbi:MAG TPA: DUF4350 domain-containing protein [Gemmatimonadaceae bacterium]|jgi:hypothetical protein|nr:DUF4350 domain-containing protein [Gemmatimonadaceae bacterium]
MTESTTKQTRRRRELILLAAVLLFFIAVALFTPQQTLSRDWRASSLSAEPRGARIAYELADRLGWTSARSYSDSITPDERTIAVVLSPPLNFRAKEAHALLEAVRRGGALLYAMGDETLNDSLHLHVGPPGYEIRPDSLQPAGESCVTPNPFSDRVITSFQGRSLFLLAVEDSGRIAAPVDTLVTVRIESAKPDSLTPTVRPAVIGFKLGRGHVIAIGDVDLFRNENMRMCAWDAAVQVVRMFEYLRGPEGPSARTTLVFDEYHQGNGVRPGTTRAITRYLRNTSSGKALAQLGVAGIVLLLALGPRALAPRDPERIERRSPLEHVDALARAYWQVHATRTATRRLLRGIRRRTEHRFGGARRDLADEDFLGWVYERIPTRRDDIALVKNALTEQMPRKDFTRVGEALRRIEHDLLTHRS